MNLGLSGKRVLVTGASRGIGRAIAKQFLIEGSDVIIVSRGSNDLIDTRDVLAKEFGEKRITAEVCDCSDTQAIGLLKSRICDHTPHLDIVVANVGDGQSVADPIPDQRQWEYTWKSNFDSAITTAREFLPTLIEAKGCLLFVSSITALEAFGAPVDYSTAKAAITAFAKNVARKVAMEVRINVVAPGNIFFEDGSWDTKLSSDPETVNNYITSNVPMRRFGLPSEIADAVVFLCSERATFITGSVLVVDGGQTVRVL